MPQIIDGFAGEPHVDSNDTRIFNASLVGPGVVRTSIGGKCEATLADNNTVSIANGEFVAQGTRVRVPKAESVKIANGVSDMNRIDVIVCHYEVDPETSVESTDWKVIQGVASAGEPEVPAHIEGNVLEGATVADWPFCQVRFTGLTLSAPEPLAKVYQPYPAEIERLDEACDSIKQTPLTEQVWGNTVTVSAGESGASLITPAVKKGYRPVGLVGAQAGTSWLSLAGFTWHGDRGEVVVRNYFTNSVTATPSAFVLYLPVA